MLLGRRTAARVDVDMPPRVPPRARLQCSLHVLMLCLMACDCLPFACGVLALESWPADARACVSLDAGHACELAGAIPEPPKRKRKERTSTDCRGGLETPPVCRLHGSEPCCQPPVVGSRLRLVHCGRGPVSSRPARCGEEVYPLGVSQVGSLARSGALYVSAGSEEAPGCITVSSSTTALGSLSLFYLPSWHRTDSVCTGR